MITFHISHIHYAKLFREIRLMENGDTDVFQVDGEGFTFKIKLSKINGKPYMHWWEIFDEHSVPQTCDFDWMRLSDFLL